MSQATHLSTRRRLLSCLPMEALTVLASCVWRPGGSPGHGGPRWRVEATGAPPRQQPVAHAPLAAGAWLALCAGRHAGPAAAPGRGAAPGGVRHEGGESPGLLGVWRAEQPGLWGETASR